MADQTVRVSNMPDNESGNPARVAWDMVKFLQKLLPETQGAEARISAYLDLYADCLHAARGLRDTTKR